MTDASNATRIDDRSNMRIVRLIIAFLIGGSILAAYFWFCLRMPWSKISVLVPWIALVLILILGFLEGRGKAKWFKDAQALAEYQTSIWTRGVPDEQDPTFKASADRAVAYTDRQVDRQINKARGILPFNSIIMTVLSFERSRMHLPTLSTTEFWDALILYWLPTSAFIAVLVILGTSSWLCLNLFLVHWNKGHYGGYEAEVKETLRLFVSRSINIQWATIWSETSLFVGLCLVIMTEGSAISS